MSKRGVPSCDTFVALPPATDQGCIIFGKNADRPESEVQEVIHIPATDHPAGSKVKCTYIEIEQVSHTHDVILSKPAWMWGAEMGSNHHGVCIGNEAVWTKLNGPQDYEKKLLGMDLLRLGLERGSCAREALDVITELLVQHGQAGICDQVWHMTYHNSFLLADRTEAWLLETAASHWAAQRITHGVRNISNELTIRTKIDAMSDNCQEFAKSKGWWNPDDGEFDFAKSYSDDFEDTELVKDKPPSSRRQWGLKLMQERSEGGSFKATDMMSILRHEESGICMTGGFESAGSQVSILTPPSSPAPCSHWFTATPNPCHSLFKPFIFCDNADIGLDTVSPSYGDRDPVVQNPACQHMVDRQHALYKAHGKLRSLLEGADARGAMLVEQMRQMEQMCVEDTHEVCAKFDERSKTKVAPIFKHMVDLEMNFYK